MALGHSVGIVSMPIFRKGSDMSQDQFAALIIALPFLLPAIGFATYALAMAFATTGADHG